jgi:hypothetical protein
MYVDVCVDVLLYWRLFIYGLFIWFVLYFVLFVYFRASIWVDRRVRAGGAGDGGGNGPEGDSALLRDAVRMADNGALFFFS